MKTKKNARRVGAQLGGEGEAVTGENKDESKLPNVSKTHFSIGKSAGNPGEGMPPLAKNHTVIGRTPPVIGKPQSKEGPWRRSTQ